MGSCFHCYIPFPSSFTTACGALYTLCGMLNSWFSWKTHSRVLTRKRPRRNIFTPWTIIWRSDHIKKTELNFLIPTNPFAILEPCNPSVNVSGLWSFCSSDFLWFFIWLGVIVGSDYIGPNLPSINLIYAQIDSIYALSDYIFPWKKPRWAQGWLGTHENWAVFYSQGVKIVLPNFQGNLNGWKKFWSSRLTHSQIQSHLIRRSTNLEYFESEGWEGRPYDILFQ